MFVQLLAIARNAFFESIRQPVMLVVLVAATILLILSSPLSTFTMEDDQRMLIDLGMATVFLAGTILAALVATNVLGDEIANRTALTVISKPVGRPLFVVGKYLGVAAALLVALAWMAFVFMLVEEHQVLQTVRDPVHLPVVAFGIGAILLGLATAAWCNYFYEMVFTSTLICTTTPLLALAYLLSLNFDPEFTRQAWSIAFKPNLWIGIVSMTMALLVLTAIAVTASTRLGQLMTLLATVGLFLLGLLSDWIFGRQIRRLEGQWLSQAAENGQVESVERVIMIERVDGEVTEFTRSAQESLVPLTDFATGWEHAEYIAYWIGYSVLPNFQVLWLSDALTQGHVVPGSYLVRTSVYGLLYVTATLAVGVALFQRREVG